MTRQESNDVTVRSALFGIWNAATIFGALFCLMFMPGPSNWIVAGLVLVTGLSFYPLFRKMEREFLASTEWAQQQGIRPGTLRRFRKSRLQKAVLSIVTVVAILIIVRMFFCEAFIVPSDCASPELPSGSRFLAWKMTKTFAPAT